MEFIVPISVGLMIQFLNFIEIYHLIKKSQRKTPFEIILLSLAFADFLAGTSALLLGIGRLLYLPPSTAKSDVLHILFIAVDSITAFSVTVSLGHVLLIAIERFAAVYFPIHHRVFVSTKKISWTIITLMWMVSAALLLVYFFQFKTCLISGLITVLLLTVFLVIIYGLIARKIILNKRQQNRSVQLHNQGHGNKIQRLVIINSGIIVACFIFCSFPWVILIMLKLLKGWEIEKDQFEYHFTYFTVVLNSLLDPLIYFLVSYCRRRKGI